MRSEKKLGIIEYSNGSKNVLPLAFLLKNKQAYKHSTVLRCIYVLCFGVLFFNMYMQMNDVASTLHANAICKLFYKNELIDNRYQAIDIKASVDCYNEHNCLYI